MADLWRWPYEPELDRNRVARVHVPKEARSFLEVQRRVELLLPDGSVYWGVVTEFNKIAWIARVRVESHA